MAGVKGWLRDAAGSCGPRDAVMVTLLTCCSLFLFDGLQVSGCSQTAGQGAGQWVQPDSWSGGWSMGWSVGAAKQLVSVADPGEVHEETKEEWFDSWGVH